MIRVRNIFSATFLVIALPTSALSQSPIGICQTLATSGLVDKDDFSYTESVALKEFRDVCTNKERRQQNFSASSSGFQAGFKGFSLGASASNTGGMSKEDIDRACDRGEKEYSRHIGLSQKQLRGSFFGAAS